MKHGCEVKETRRDQELLNEILKTPFRTQKNRKIRYKIIINPIHSVQHSREHNKQKEDMEKACGANEHNHITSSELLTE
jgi:hypothetical protein